MTVMVASACLFFLSVFSQILLYEIMLMIAPLFSGFASTWGPCVWIVIGETFALRTRAKQSSLSNASSWLCNFLLAFFTPFIGGAIHYRYGFIFAALNLTGVLVVFFFLYESSELSLEAVDAVSIFLLSRSKTLA
jgi:MFS transporter, SP family, sugar:H+ symporter